MYCDGLLMKSDRSVPAVYEVISASDERCFIGENKTNQRDAESSVHSAKAIRFGDSADAKAIRRGAHPNFSLLRLAYHFVEGTLHNFSEPLVYDGLAPVVSRAVLDPLEV